jgi:two-component system phosphate regulon response regulator PhoB
MKATTPLILIIEDEDAIKEMLKLSLRMAGFATMEAADTKGAQGLMGSRLPDLIVLDWMLPGQSGVQYIKKLRQEDLTKHIPIILLTAKAEEENKIIGLDAGADDYITKPFSPRELIMRIKTVLRRGLILSTDATITLHQLVLNTQTRQVNINNNLVALTPKTFELLLYLLKHKDRICTREQLLNHVWGITSLALDRTVDVHIKRLRSALQPFGYERYIQTLHSVGYRLTETT